MEELIFNDPNTSPRFKQAARVFVDSLPESRFRPVTPVGQLLWNEHIRAMEAGIYLQFDPADVRRNAQLALSNSASIVQRELDRIYKPVERPVLRWPPIVASYALLLAVAFACMVVYCGRRRRERGYFRQEFRAGYAFAAPWFMGCSIRGWSARFFDLHEFLQLRRVFTAAIRGIRQLPRDGCRRPVVLQIAVEYVVHGSGDSVRHGGKPGHGSAAES